MEINLKKLSKKKKKNIQERIEFIDNYVEWLKKTPNKEWSKQVKKIID